MSPEREQIPPEALPRPRDFIIDSLRQFGVKGIAVASALALAGFMFLAAEKEASEPTDTPGAIATKATTEATSQK